MTKLDRLSLAIATGLFASIAAGPALAGDAAELNVLGFSSDGKLFAFEQYGTQDGSGFAYADRFYIDTATDSFAAGSPFRVVLQNETDDESATRKQAAQLGAKAGKDEDFSYDWLVAFHALTETSADPHRMVANPAPYFPPILPDIGLRLEEVPASSPADCSYAEGGIKGFRLVRFNPDTQADIAVLHDEATVPKSRSCPQSYRLTGLYTRLDASGRGGQFAVVIAVRSPGFEGPDYRYIAILGQL